MNINRILVDLVHMASFTPVVKNLVCDLCSQCELGLVFVQLEIEIVQQVKFKIVSRAYSRIRFNHKVYNQSNSQSYIVMQIVIKVLVKKIVRIRVVNQNSQGKIKRGRNKLEDCQCVVRVVMYQSIDRSGYRLLSCQGECVHWYQEGGVGLWVRGVGRLVRVLGHVSYRGC